MNSRQEIEVIFQKLISERDSIKKTHLNTTRIIFLLRSMDSRFSLRKTPARIVYLLTRYNMYSESISSEEKLMILQRIEEIFLDGLRKHLI